MLPADPRTLGATLTDGGCNFALWSNAATAVELCLFNEVNGKLVETRFALSHRNGQSGMGISQVFAPGSAMAIASTARGHPNTDRDLMQQSY